MKTQNSISYLATWILGYVNDRQQDVADLLKSKKRPLASDISFPVIDVHNALANFMRSYCLSSLSGAYMADGSRVTVAKAIEGHRSALTFAVQTERPRKKGKGPWKHRDEPTWHDPNVVIRVLNSAGCSNARGVSSALSLPSQAIEHLTTARNFLAHRNESTALSLRRVGRAYGVTTPCDPLTVMIAVGHGRTQRIVEDWLDDIYTIFSLFPR